MNNIWIGILMLIVFWTLYACQNKPADNPNIKSISAVSAADILGNPNYMAISYGGYRDTTRDIQPTVAQLKEDMKILSAMNIKIVRTYHTKRAHAGNVLKAIRELKSENPSFDMYVMLGAWIDCKDAWTDNPNHNDENEVENAAEVDRAVQMAQHYPDIVKIIAIGNEAMVKWAETYFVQPGIILKWVNYVQDLKNKGSLPNDLWVTSSDNFASWGGGEDQYHVDDLSRLIKAVDYVSMHTYPMHDTHYNPTFWGVAEGEEHLSDIDKIEAAMVRSRDYAIHQYKQTTDYVHSIDPSKELHIGETGWASASNGFYGPTGSRATDEYKEGRYYKLMREWTTSQGISCFYFEAFDEPWKDAYNPEGSENHFGLFDVNGQAKFAIWDQVDQGLFSAVSRGNRAIMKTYDGDLKELLKDVEVPAKIKIENHNL